jgi:hypothetical protein
VQEPIDDSRATWQLGRYRALETSHHALGHIGHGMRCEERSCLVHRTRRRVHLDAFTVRECVASERALEAFVYSIRHRFLPSARSRRGTRPFARNANLNDGGA